MQGPRPLAAGREFHFGPFYVYNPQNGQRVAGWDSAGVTIGNATDNAPVSYTGASFKFNGVSIQDAGNLFTTGVVPAARLGSGTASSNTFLRGDQSYQQVAFSNLSGQIATGQLTSTAPTTNYYLQWTGSAITWAPLGSGTASSNTFLRGDQSYQQVAFSNLSGQIATGQLTSTAPTTNYYLQWTGSAITWAPLTNPGLQPGVTIQADPGGTPSGAAGSLWLYY